VTIAPAVLGRVAARLRRVEGSFRSPLHDTRVAALLGIALGVAFTTCFLTGLASHLAQDEPSWFDWPARPAGLYRITQGIHVVAGLCTIPLLLAKLWVVYPRLTAWPPARSVTHAVERLMLLPLVAGAVFLLFSGTANVAGWFPWPFFFPRAHFWAAWITVGALVVHVGAKATVARRVLRRSPGPGDEGRRTFLAGVAASAGMVFLATSGGTVAPLTRVSALAQRRLGVGPQGVPVNKSAVEAGVEDRLDPVAYRLVVEGRVERTLALELEELRGLPQHEAELPIACVEGWSQSARWRGVRVADLLALAGAPDGSEVLVESIQSGGRYRQSELNAAQAADPDTLLALELGDEVLHPDHGFPARLIGPNRPGVLQTKWVRRLVVR
jgi:hypothetical protein